MQSVYSDPSEIPGFDELREADQEKIRRAWEEGEVPEDEKPEPASEHIDPRYVYFITFFSRQFPTTSTNLNHFC